MALPRHIFAPAFRHQKLSWLFACLVGIMVYVATFSMATEATLSAITFTWDKGMEARMTVSIPAVSDEASRTQADRLQQAVSILRGMPDITRVTLVSDEETTRLLRPWISEPALLKAISVPSLIDIERKTASTITASDIQSRLKNTIHDVRVDDHAVWLTDMKNLVRGLSAIAGLMIILTGITLIIAVSLICRAIMATEHETISLLHIMGAEDNDIAEHFQFHAARLAWPASWIGFVAAMVSVAILLFFLRHFADPAMLQPLHWMGLIITALLVPLIAIWMTAFTARISTLKLLHLSP